MPTEKNQDIKPGKEKLFQVGKKESRDEKEFKRDAVSRKYSKDPQPAKPDKENQESLRDEEEVINNEGRE